MTKVQIKPQPITPEQMTPYQLQTIYEMWLEMLIAAGIVPEGTRI